MNVDGIAYFAKVKPRGKWDYQLAHNTGSLIFLPSVHVGLRDGEDGEPLMKDRIDQFARDDLDKRIKFTSINSLDKWG